MANPSKGEIDIDLGGKTYTLRPSFEAITEFEEMTGFTAMRALVLCNDVQTCTVKLVATAVYTGIRGSCDTSVEKANLPTYVQVGEMIMRGKGGYSRILTEVVQYLGNGLMDDETLQANAEASVKNSEGSTD